MKETAVPSMWPLCHLGAQTPGRPDTRGGHGGRAPPQLQHLGPGHSPQAWPCQDHLVPAGLVSSPQLCLSSSSGHVPGCIGTTVQIGRTPSMRE